MSEDDSRAESSISPVSPQKPRPRQSVPVLQMCREGVELQIATLRAPRDAPPLGQEAPAAVLLRMCGMPSYLLDAPVGCIEVASIRRATWMQMRRLDATFMHPMGASHR